MKLELLSRTANLRPIMQNNHIFIHQLDGLKGKNQIGEEKFTALRKSLRNIYQI